ncbi:hypothetical protein VitviT2T_021580 [Vitis vinifera]|uniref:Replication protein A OB domain-containing protein n=1 Tax=Vitis vinifera TaxID=29760 RepID=A0ABY9D7D6_VITVI|nr:hypothetical protein VitviT2T_021580 [Vitis vinifera]
MIGTTSNANSMHQAEPFSLESIGLVDFENDFTTYSKSKQVKSSSSAIETQCKSISSSNLNSKATMNFQIFTPPNPLPAIGQESRLATASDSNDAADSEFRCNSNDAVKAMEIHRKTENASVFESEKLGVAILGRRFSDKDSEQLVDSQHSSEATNEEIGDGKDFSGIEMFAAAACNNSIGDDVTESTTEDGSDGTKGDICIDKSETAGLINNEEKQETETKPEVDPKATRNEPITKIVADGVQSVYNGKEAIGNEDQGAESGNVVSFISSSASIIRKNGTKIQKRTLHLKDMQGRSVELILWRNFYNAEGQRLQNMWVFPVLVVKSARINDFNGKAVGTISTG